MNRAFTTREKVMLVTLAVLMIVIGYYKLILEPINTGIDEYNAKAAEEQDIITTNMMLVQKKKMMEAELETLFANGEPTPIPSYDNVGVVIVELHSILDGTVDYSLNFSNTAYLSGGYLIRRPIRLDFTAGDYAQARSIINRLHNSVNINQISDLDISLVRDRELDGNTVSVSMLITYFELEQ